MKGGLGLLNIRLKALVGLIRSFLDTACISKFQPSLQLLHYYVFEERDIKDAGRVIICSRLVQRYYFRPGLDVCC